MPNEKLIIAEIDVGGEPGDVIKLGNFLTSAVADFGILAQVRKGQRKIIISGDLSEISIEQLKAKVSPIVARYEAQTNLGLDVQWNTEVEKNTKAAEVHEAQQTAQRKSEIIVLEGQLRKAQSEIKELRKTNDELLQYERDAESILTQYQKDSDSLKIELSEVKKRYSQLQSVHSTASSRLAVIEKSVSAVGSIYDRIIAHLSQSAEKISEIEEIVGNDVFESSSDSIDSAILSFNSNDFGISLNSEDEVIAAAANYLYDGEKCSENIGILYKKINPEKSKKYEQANSEKQAAEMQKKILSDLPEDVRAPALLVVAKNTRQAEKTAAEYESDLAEFSGNLKSALRDCELSLESRSDKEKVKQKLNEKEFSSVPLYITLTESEDSYKISVYLPQKIEQKSRICDIVLSETVFSESVMEFVKQEEMDSIQIVPEKNSGLKTYELSLKKQEHSIDDAVEICNEIKNSAKAGYSNTSFAKLGISLDALFSETIDFADDEPSVKLPPKARYELREKRRTAVRQFIEARKENAFSINDLYDSVVQQLKEQGASYGNIVLQNIRDDLNRVFISTGQVKKQGSGRGTTYVYNPDGAE
jgi:hypothetical protein